MDPAQLFDRVRALWPDVIVLKSDARREDDDPIWSVVDTYDEIERQLGEQGDEWIELAAFAFHQALFELARKKLEVGQLAVRPSEIPFEAFDAQMRDNLSNESWVDVRHEYGG